MLEKNGRTEILNIFPQHQSMALHLENISIINWIRQHTHLNLIYFNTFFEAHFPFDMSPLYSSLHLSFMKSAADTAEVTSSTPSPSYFMSSKHPQPSNLLFLLFPPITPPSCFPSHPLFLYLNWLCLSPSAGSSFSGPAPVHTSSPVGHLFSQPPHLHLSFSFALLPSLFLSARCCQGRSWLS